MMLRTMHDMHRRKLDTWLRWTVCVVIFGLTFFFLDDVHAQIGAREVLDPDEAGYNGDGFSRFFQRVLGFLVLLVLGLVVLGVILGRANANNNNDQSHRKPLGDDEGVGEKDARSGASPPPKSQPITVELARWAALGTRLYDKVDHKLYRYRYQKSTNVVQVLDETSDRALFGLDPAQIDVIKMSDGIAKVKCPKCKSACTAQINTWVQMKCRRCRFVWQQHLVIYSDEPMTGSDRGQDARNT